MHWQNVIVLPSTTSPAPCLQGDMIGPASLLDQQHASKTAQQLDKPQRGTPPPPHPNLLASVKSNCSWAGTTVNWLVNWCQPSYSLTLLML